MTEIGVIGGGEAASTLNEICGGVDAAVHNLDGGVDPRRFDILVFNDFSPVAPGFLKQLKTGDFVVMNGDNKRLYSCLGGCLGRLITYGFSSKACVTASSVIEQPYESIQLCIQRTLPTLAGDALEPQEFPVLFKSPKNICCALAAVSAALIAGVPPERFAVL